MFVITTLYGGLRRGLRAVTSKVYDVQDEPNAFVVFGNVCNAAAELLTGAQPALPRVSTDN